MCTRYYIERDDSHIQSIIEPVQQSSLTALMQEKLKKTIVTNGEVRPTDIATVIASNKNGSRSVFPMIWGFTLPSTSSSHDPSIESVKNRKPQLLVNCRIETAASKPLWKDSWFQRRCIIPASCYYEWGPSTSDQIILNTLIPTDGRAPLTATNEKKGRTKYAIRPKIDNETKNDATSSTEKTMCLAGLYRIENGYPHFTVLTREPGINIRFIHNRMPVILKKDYINDWINPQSEIRTIEAIAQAALTEMEYMRSE